MWTLSFKYKKISECLLITILPLPHHFSDNFCKKIFVRLALFKNIFYFNFIRIIYYFDTPKLELHKLKWDPPISQNYVKTKIYKARFIYFFHITWKRKNSRLSWSNCSTTHFSKRRSSWMKNLGRFRKFLASSLFHFPKMDIKEFSSTPKPKKNLKKYNFFN